MSNWKIPFNKPYLAGNEIAYIKKTFEREHTASTGEFTAACERFLAAELNSKKILLTTSCTSALEMSSLLVHLKPDDEVILPSFTFVTTATAFHLRGAKLRFCDIRPDTLNIDETKIEPLVNSRTKLIVPVHYGGVACEMDTIMSIASKNNLLVVEDAAQAIGAKYKDSALGTIGDLGAFSFHETKNIISGEGGALSVNKPSYRDRADILREKGTNRKAFLEGHVDKYTWVDQGSSYAPSELVAAFLLAQLEKTDEIFEMRKQVYIQYHNELEHLEKKGILRRPIIPKDCAGNYHNYFILLNSMGERQALMDYLSARSIMSVFHYIPLHTSPMGLSMGNREGSLPVTEDLAGRILRLPFYNTLAESDIGEITGRIREYFKQ